MRKLKHELALISAETEALLKFDNMLNELTLRSLTVSAGGYYCVSFRDEQRVELVALLDKFRAANCKELQPKLDKIACLEQLLTGDKNE